MILLSTLLATSTLLTPPTVDSETQEFINEVHKDSIKKLEDLNRVYNQEDSLKKIQTDEISHLLDKVGQKPCDKGCAKKSLDRKMEIEGKLPLYIFVSFSMPEGVLKKLGHDAHKIGAKLVLRGLFENSFVKTGKKVMDLGINVMIDPNLFKDHKIERVPTFLYLKDKGGNEILRGNVNLDFVLETFKEGDQSKDPNLNEALEKIRGDVS